MRRSSNSGGSPRIVSGLAENTNSIFGDGYNRARYSNPAIGRFLSEDPLGSAGSGPNLYEYAGDSPTNFVDLSGLDKNQGSSNSFAAMLGMMVFQMDSEGDAPNTGAIRPLGRWECASYRADKELSIASMKSGDSPDNPKVQAFLGNSISGVFNLFTSN